MVIGRDDWGVLKNSEAYHMYSLLQKRVDGITEESWELSKRLRNLERRLQVLPPGFGDDEGCCCDRDVDFMTDDFKKKLKSEYGEDWGI